MILQVVIVALIPIYFLSWAIGCVESIFFHRYMWRNHPEVAAVYFPGLLKGSIYQQLKTMAWLWKRQYVDLGDTGLIQRADVHRRVNFIAYGLMVISMIGVLVGGQRAFSSVQEEAKEATRLDVNRLQAFQIHFIFLSIAPVGTHQTFGR